MSLTNEYNLTDHQARTRLGMSATFDQETIFEVRAVYRKVTGNWKLCASSIEAIELAKENRIDEYKEYSFCIAYKAFKDVKKIFQLLYKDGINLSEKYPAIMVDQPSRWREYLIPSIFSRNRTPIRHFASHISLENYNDGPLIGYNLPYYSSFNMRVKEFIPYENSDNGCIHLLIEDGRAKLINDNNIVKLMHTTDVSIVGEIETGKGKNKIGFDGKKNGDINIEKAISIELWVIDRNNFIYDYISTSAYPYQFKINIQEKTQEESIQEKIKNGETTNCEFKKYIDIGKGDGKAEEIDRTVCALSNTDGGDIIIGVSDNGEILGLSSDVRRKYSSTLTDALNEYSNEIRKRLYENLTSNDCFSVNKIEVCGKNLIVISVWKTKKWNFLQATQVPYVRKGSTNYNATHLVALELESANRSIGNNF